MLCQIEAVQQNGITVLALCNIMATLRIKKCIIAMLCQIEPVRFRTMS